MPAGNVKRLGTIRELWRYPVKSMPGERLEGPVAVGPEGIEGDRVRAVVDEVTGKVLSAKTVPALLSASTSWDSAELTSFLGRPVRLAAPVVGEQAIFDMDVDPDRADEVLELRTPPGVFFDSRSTLHLLTVASLGRADVRRFRPNLLVETDGAGAFPEDEWVGRRLRLGGGVEATVRKRTSRCVLVTRAQPGLPKDSDIHRALVRDRGGDLGVYLDPQTEGRLSTGDPVELLE
ncbi:MAG TPA: MOSC N-terminal beta barrel domain-containing protein [Acidimicrobiales bacterium]|nr:MOSC N-terminal beta barrel domain-containing protein [Acidimicrobiales bacterium]